MSHLRSICVFCGSSAGRNDTYREAAAALGAELASGGRQLVFGGGRVGLMGVLADAVLAGGGRAVGVIPQHLVDREVAHVRLTELHVVGSMHERKAMMSSLADGFIVLPGGIGTLEEFFEIWTWGQLGLHRKPYGLLNVDGFFDPLLRFLDHAAAERFIRDEHRAMLVIEERVDRLLERLDIHEVPPVPKWVDASRT